MYIFRGFMKSNRKSLLFIYVESDGNTIKLQESIINQDVIFFFFVPIEIKIKILFSTIIFNKILSRAYLKTNKLL